MTAEEMGREFDLLYNNIMSNAAPGIDEYEKSLFLTKAQEQLVTSIYDGTFEGSEKLRECINPLVATKVYNSATDALSDSSLISVDAKSKFFELPERAWYILYEELSPISEDACESERKVVVKPIKLDEYYKVSQNPFRKARKFEALRLNTNGDLEIISTYPEYKYKLRYLQKPYPIIICSDASIYGGNAPTIDGVLVTDAAANPNPYNCKLLSAIHRAIVEAAVSLAIAAYKSTNN